MHAGGPRRVRLMAPATAHKSHIYAQFLPFFDPSIAHSTGKNPAKAPSTAVRVAASKSPAPAQEQLPNISVSVPEEVCDFRSQLTHILPQTFLDANAHVPPGLLKATSTTLRIEVVRLLRAIHASSPKLLNKLCQFVVRDASLINDVFPIWLATALKNSHTHLLTSLLQLLNEVKVTETQVKKYKILRKLSDQYEDPNVRALAKITSNTWIDLVKAQRSASAATTTTVQQQSVMTDNSTSSTTKKSSTKSKGSNKNKRVYYDASQDVDIFASTGTSISSTAPSTTSLTAQLSSTKTRKNSIEAGLFPKVSQAPKDIPLDTTERDDASSASSGSGDSTTSQSNGASMLNQPSMDAVAGKSSLKRMRLDSPLDSSVSSSQSSLQKPNQGETAPAATINPAQLNNNDPIMDLVHQPKRQKRKSVSWKPDSQLVRYYYIETRAEQKMQRQQPREDMAMEGRALKARGKAMAETGGVVMAAGKIKNATSAGLDAQIPDWYTPKEMEIVPQPMVEAPESQAQRQRELSTMEVFYFAGAPAPPTPEELQDTDEIARISALANNKEQRALIDLRTPKILLSAPSKYRHLVQATGGGSMSSGASVGGFQDQGPVSLKHLSALLRATGPVRATSGASQPSGLGGSGVSMGVPETMAVMYQNTTANSMMPSQQQQFMSYEQVPGAYSHQRPMVPMFPTAARPMNAAATVSTGAPVYSTLVAPVAPGHPSVNYAYPAYPQARPTQQPQPQQSFHNQGAFVRPGKPGPARRPF